MSVHSTSGPEPTIYAFGIPSKAYAHGGIEFALHRRRNNYYMVHPRAYGMAESRWFASLNQPRSADPAETAPPVSHPHLNRRFWYNSSEVTLEDLLTAQPISGELEQLLKVTGTIATQNRAGWGGQPDVEVKQVEVVLDEDRFCRRCEYCGGWESTTDGGQRYQKVGQNGDDVMYWCGYCTRIWRAIWSSLTPSVTLSAHTHDPAGFDITYFQFKG